MRMLSMCYERLLCILIGVLTSSFSDGVFVITINMDENGSKVGKIAMNVENSDVQVIKENLNLSGQKTSLSTAGFRTIN